MPSIVNQTVCSAFPPDVEPTGSVGPRPFEGTSELPQHLPFDSDGSGFEEVLVDLPFIDRVQAPLRKG